jgi:DNA-directed RNA polymerase subunit RPC12/RpoP
MPAYTLTLCDNPDCRAQLIDVAIWCPSCSSRTVVRVRLEVSEEQIAAGERRADGDRPTRRIPCLTNG